MSKEQRVEAAKLIAELPTIPVDTRPRVKHTPGPWKATEEKIEWQITGDGLHVAEIRKSLYYKPYQKQERANAALIAAAPDLLQALEYAAELIKIARNHFPKSMRNGDKFQLENTCATIGKAIAKARGEA